MPLYHVQDEDYGAFVLADSFEDALWDWSDAVAEAEDLPEAVYQPSEGIHLVCHDMELIVGGKWCDSDMDQEFEDDEEDTSPAAAEADEPETRKYREASGNGQG